MVRTKNESPYEGFKVDLLLNKNELTSSSLFKHSDDKEGRLKRLEELKRAKSQLFKMEQAMYAERKK